MTEITEYPDRDIMMQRLAGLLAGELAQALAGGGRASLAVPGGTTPGPVFDALSAADLDWSRVNVMLTDERWVPESSERSNTRLLRRRLLTGRAAAARLVPLHVDAPTPEDALEALSRGVRDALPLSVCLLGMGADMHTASLFPGADRLTEALAADAPVLMAMRAPGAPEPRVTLTAPVLAGAVSLHLLIAGADKRAALDRALSPGPVEAAPVRAILSAAHVHYAE
jgi:6-phosphogluconolactonase